MVALVALGCLASQAVAGSNEYALHLLDAGSGADRVLVSSRAHEYTPLAFSDSGDALTVLRGGGGHDQIQRLVLADGSRKRLSAQRLPGGSDPLPPVSVDRRLASGAPIVRGKTVRWHIWIGRLSGRVMTWLPMHYVASPALAWSSDGKRLVAVGPHAHYRWTVDVFARSGRLLSSLSLGHRRYVQAPQLSPDGTRVLLNLPPREGLGQATVVDLPTGQLAPLQPVLESLPGLFRGVPVSWATWSPTGDRVLATRYPGLQIELFDAASLQRSDALVPDHQVYEPSAVWSPDGQRVLMTEIGDAGDGIALLDLSGPTPVTRELVPMQRGRIVAAVWSRDSRTIAYDRS